MTRLTLTLPDRWTPTLARDQMDRYERLVDEHRKAIEVREWAASDDAGDVMREIADDLIEAAVLRGTWSVEDAT